MKNVVLACLGVLFLLPFAVSGQQCRLSVKGIVQQPSCEGGMDGSIQLQLSGGKGPYTISWNNGQTERNMDHLTSGTYRVKVTDEQGCTANTEFVLSAATKELALQVRQQETSAGKKILEVRFAGNIKPYATYIKSLSQGLRAPQIAYTGQALEKGVYLLEAFTEAGCSVLSRVEIEVN